MLNNSSLLCLSLRLLLQDLTDHLLGSAFVSFGQLNRLMQFSQKAHKLIGRHGRMHAGKSAPNQLSTFTVQNIKLNVALGEVDVRTKKGWQSEHGVRLTRYNSSCSCFTWAKNTAGNPPTNHSHTHASAKVAARPPLPTFACRFGRG